MKYFILLLPIFLFLGCNKKTKINEANNTKEINITKKEYKFKTIILDKNFTLKFKNDKLIYPSKKTVLLFYDKNFFSKEQIKVLQKLKIKFYKTKNKFLKKYFNINYYPTIVVLDKNKTIKFENFTPYEILKAEGL